MSRKFANIVSAMHNCSSVRTRNAPGRGAACPGADCPERYWREAGSGGAYYSLNLSDRSGNSDGVSHLTSGQVQQGVTGPKLASA